MSDEARPYRPSNGTEGECFMSQWCMLCKRGDMERNPEGDGEWCEIGTDMLMGIQRDEWIKDETGPRCTAFEAMPDDGVGRLDDPRQPEML